MAAAHESNHAALSPALDRFVRHSGTLPLPGGGRTAERWAELSRVAAVDLSVARLAEGHADAAAILAEAGVGAEAGLWAVWAARSPDADLDAVGKDHSWHVDGAKVFCSGAGYADHALVTASAPDGSRLFAVDVQRDGVAAVAGTWPALGMAASDSLTVRFHEVPAAPVGAPGFYLDRPGFWFGAIGVAACWLGGARGLLDRISRHLASGKAASLALADLGVAEAALAGAQATLNTAAATVDDDPHDRKGNARRLSLEVRQVVHSACTTALERAAAAGGARPLCLDPEQSQRAADLYAYLAQHHGSRDAAELGRLVVDDAR